VVHRFAREGRALCGVVCSLLTYAGLPSMVSAQAVNLGQAVEMRFENATNHDSGSPVGQTKLVLSTLLDTSSEGPFVVTLEQSRRVLATASCNAQPVVYSGEAQPGQGYLRECATPYIPSANIATNQPVDVAIALVDDATDARTELYRGTFPVIAFSDWKGNGDNGPVHVEQRALRLDSFLGAAFVRQYLGSELQFSYVDIRNVAEVPNESALRCKVGAGEWRAYNTSLSEGSVQTARNRVFADGSVHEDGQETLVTQFLRFSTQLPIGVASGTRRGTAGTSMDGTWTCELRVGGSGQRVVVREFRFDVRNAMIQPHAIESQVRPGRGTAIISVGLNPEQMPAILDPALVRDTVAGRRLTGATAPLVSAMPARATNPAFTAPPRAAAASGRGGGRRR
jgi:hypothetical protein